MANLTLLNDDGRGGCLAPFFNEVLFPTTGGHVDGRLCAPILGQSCCLPCPMTDWTYPDSFTTSTAAASWVNVVGMIGCVFLLLSWAVLPVEKTHRHYLSICLTGAVVLMNLGFIIPLAAKPNQCFNEITPNGMDTSSVCAASGAFLLAGGWAGVMWVFLRALSLHLQICWQLVVGRNYMWFSQGLGWGIPIIGLIILLVFSGVSFRFGATCHINHENSLADFWIPLLVFAGLTVIIQFATFGYCIKVYLASLTDNSATTEGSGMPSYSNSIRTMTPRQAYRRVRRVIQLQWRGIAIVLIIITDVIFFAIVFVFLDSTVQSVKVDPTIAEPWVLCLMTTGGNKNACLDKAAPIIVSLSTVTVMLILLAINGLWLLLLLGRWSMVTGWIDWFTGFGSSPAKKEFVSVDARMDFKTDPRSYEMLSHESTKNEHGLTPISALQSPGQVQVGRRTPDYFGTGAQYQPHQRSFSSPRPPQSQHSQQSPQVQWDVVEAYQHYPQQQQQQTPLQTPQQYPQQPAPAHSPSPYPQTSYESMNPLGMNRIEKDDEAGYSPATPYSSTSRGHQPDFSRDHVFI
ncbi:Uu.00g044420.m01.CDS01 [Anthostomella pinea]|uniref:Uu.00g044420.m01.CDS01 n=1 Tax=Anthostomella pinea TaxID=933095 RepID=A0AAI8VAY0_9PEZI|nr:Uu.00g044420.m01.CDS01 [Anthostomella pinea]